MTLRSASTVPTTGNDTLSSFQTTGFNLNALAGNDHVFGRGGNDTLTGGIGNDSLWGGSGNDSLSGGDNNDLLHIERGDDVLSGGSGFDTARIGASTVRTIQVSIGGGEVLNTLEAEDLEAAEGYFIHLGDGTYGGIGAVTSRATTITTGGVGFTDVVNGFNDTISFTSIEKFELSNFGDYFRDDAQNRFVDGRGGSDIFVDGGGADEFRGGTGIDWVSYEDSNAAVTVLLGENLLSGGFAEGDSLNSIENVVGSQSNDLLVGDGNANVISGLGDDDVIAGGLGADTLSGGLGNDLIRGDNLLGGGGASDSIDGQGGTDTVDYQFHSGRIFVEMADTGTSIVRVLDGTTRTFIGIDEVFPLKHEQDRIVSIENIRGAAGDDVIRGNLAANKLEGGDGQDELEGGDGNDTLVGGAGNDTLKGGGGADSLAGDGGNDTVDYRGSGNAVFIDLNQQVATGLAGSHALGDTISGIENAFGSSFGDGFVGSAANNRFLGLDGNDVFTASLGADTFDGGPGTDRVDYSVLQNARVEINLAFGSATVFVPNVLGNAPAGELPLKTDQLISIEDAIGTAGADLFIGSEEANVFEGRNGDDVARGAGGNDALFTEAGNDTLDGGGGADSLDGGDNFDLATYAGAENAINVSLATGIGTGGDAEGDRLANIEALEGGSFDDVLTGNAVANLLIGNGGANTIDGGAGNDTIRAGQGNDSLIGGEGIDLLDFSEAGGNVVVNLGSAAVQNTLFFGNDFILGFEHATTGIGNDSLTGNGLDNRLDGGTGNDSFNGGAGNDSFLGGGGNDVFRAGAGADLFDGGADIDLVNYSSASSIRVFLDGTGTNAAAAGGDVLVGIENILGAVGNDIIVGDGGSNRLSGFDGNDTIIGRDGIDQIEGGIGGDRLVGQGGNDVLVGGTGADTLVFDLALAAGGLDRVTDFEAGIDRIEIDASAFGGGLTAGGPVQLVANTAPTSAGVAGGVFLYDTDSGFLSFDADGAGAGAAIAFLRVQNLAALTAADFVVVA